MRLARPQYWTVAALAFCLIASACSDTARPTLSRVTGGSTDDPAPGFEKVLPGSEEDFILSVGRRIYFTSGSDKLDDVARETIQLQAAWLNRYPQWLAKVQGFADDPGGANANTALSEKRARAVQDYLVAQGVSPARLWFKGYGRERIVRNCDNISCKALNRRVIVNLRKKFDEAAPQFKQQQGS